MASKKEPPFFNEDNIGSFPSKLIFYETMELFIETLTGTCFELRVSPYETVTSVKSKIQRLEGIPVAQQHLIRNNMELEDECSLSGYNISEGCTLKMVLAMRGGPINTRRVPLGNPIREIAEYMDPIREDSWEKGPSNKQVTFLVYQEGEQLNFFRVVDRGDGTLTPLSESLSGGSVYNLYAEDDDEAEGSSSGQQIIENTITMNKMKLLKSKMENMNLNKKPKKMTKLKPRPPMVPRPSSGFMPSSRHRLLRVLPNIGQSYLPPGNHLCSESSHTALSAIAAARTLQSVTGDNLHKEASWETPEVVPSHSVHLPPMVSHVELENPRYNKNKVLPPVAHLKKKDILIMDDDSMFHQNMDLVSNEESSRLVTDSFDFLTDVRPVEPYRNVYTIGHVKPEFKLTEGSKGPSAIETSHKSVSKALKSEAMDTGINTSDFSPAQSNFPSQISHSPLPSLQCQSKCFEIGNLRTPTSQNLFRSVEVRNIADCSFSRTARFRGVKVDSPGKQSEVISKMAARDITKLANKASKEPVGSLNHLGFFGSLTRCTSGANMRSSTAIERPSKMTVALSNGLQYLQEESFKGMPSSCDTAESFVSPLGHGDAESHRATGKGLEATHLFAPVKSTFRNKKKTAKHCFVCGKKTGLATSFECRCGNNFCAAHRYAETHDCTYDYKTMGRRLLTEANPVIIAPKLPKI
uniref:Ubiquitin-like fusion protein n=1 Tax=Xenopus laevis TaxID=8355 RepID=Q91889_XENLA|nr:ubiquitin-like fusion protein [Xenopus laevis]